MGIGCNAGQIKPLACERRCSCASNLASLHSQLSRLCPPPHPHMADNSDQRETVGDSVLTAAILDWGPMFAEFVQMLLNDAWVQGAQLWPGAAEGAVKLAPIFSPKVAPSTVELVEREHAMLKAAAGDAAFHHIFCGP
eukprot:6495860-Prymnesium_polylepis.4